MEILGETHAAHGSALYDVRESRFCDWWLPTLINQCKKHNWAIAVGPLHSLDRITGMLTCGQDVDDYVLVLGLVLVLAHITLLPTGARNVTVFQYFLRFLG